MADRIVRISDDFWNIRGSFKLAGFIDLGTQSSLVRLQSGGFVLLDAYTLQGDVKRAVLDHTRGGRDIEAVLHLHPFHTLHVEPLAQLLPHAVHYGSARHRAKAPSVRWSSDSIESEAVQARFADDFELTVPRGVDFISKNESLHFSSVLALHKTSRTLHVDDTLTWSTLPFIGGLGFHPTLARVLERRRGAAEDFRQWGRELVETCRSVDHLVTAHMRALPPSPKGSPTLAERVDTALAGVEKTLDKHERRQA